MFSKELQAVRNQATSAEIIVTNAHSEAHSETEVPLQLSQAPRRSPDVVRRPRKHKQRSKTRRGGRRSWHKISPPACRWESSSSATADSPKCKKPPRIDATPRVAPQRGSVDPFVNASLKNMKKQAKTSGIRMPVRRSSIELPSLDKVMDMDASSPNSVALTHPTMCCQPKLDTGALIDRVLTELEIQDEDDDYEIPCAE